MSPIDQNAIEPELQALLIEIGEMNKRNASDALLLAVQGQLAFLAGIVGALARIETMLGAQQEGESK